MESTECLRAGATTTRFLESLPFTPKAIEVVAPGMNTTVQVPSLASLDTLVLSHRRRYYLYLLRFFAS